MNLFNLYVKHINPNPTGVEIHEFFKSFDLHQMLISNPNQVLDSADKKWDKEKREICADWILKNSNFKPVSDMNQEEIKRLLQQKKELKQRQKELALELEVCRIDMKFLQEKIDLLTINQFKINFDGEASTT
jgi:hypothetical protein